eukprot:981628-Pelagomonas_calceolata.AAC.4
MKGKEEEKEFLLRAITPRALRPLSDPTITRPTNLATEACSGRPEGGSLHAAAAAAVAAAAAAAIAAAVQECPGTRGMVNGPRSHSCQGTACASKRFTND